MEVPGSQTDGSAPPAAAGTDRGSRQPGARLDARSWRIAALSGPQGPGNRISGLWGDCRRPESRSAGRFARPQRVDQAGGWPYLGSMSEAPDNHQLARQLAVLEERMNTLQADLSAHP